MSTDTRNDGRGGAIECLERETETSSRTAGIEQISTMSHIKNPLQ